MRTKGFTFSLEMMVCLLLFLIMLIAINSNEKEGLDSLNRLYVLQKEHDLLQYWLKSKDFSKTSIENDFNELFKGYAGVVRINNKEIWINKGNNDTKNSVISSDAEYWSPKGGIKLTITVFY